MLDISPWLLLLTAGVFLFLVYFLNHTLYQPLLRFIQKRDGIIEDDLANANQNSADIESSLTEAHDIVAEAKAKAAKLREDAVAEAKNQANKKLAISKKKLEEQYQSFLQTLSANRDELREGLSKNLSTYQKSLQTKLKNI